MGLRKIFTWTTVFGRANSSWHILVPSSRSLGSTTLCIYGLWYSKVKSRCPWLPVESSFFGRTCTPSWRSWRLGMKRHGRCPYGMVWFSPNRGLDGRNDAQGVWGTLCLDTVACMAHVWITFKAKFGTGWFGIILQVTFLVTQFWLVQIYVKGTNSSLFSWKTNPDLEPLNVEGACDRDSQPLVSFI